MIPTLDTIRAKHAEKLVTVRDFGHADDRLVIVNYTPRCQFGRCWDETTRACRGLILRLDRPYPEATTVEEVVALPFAKFFNVGETGDWPDSPITEVTEKLDGALGILYRQDGQPWISTRGSFHSAQAVWATWHLRQTHDLSHLPENLTLLFEIVAPCSHIVVNYGDREELVLLAVRDRFTGEDWPHARVVELGRAFGLNVVRAVAHDGSLAALMERQLELTGDEEGFVVRCADGQRWKIKGDVYRELHRMLSHLSQRALVDAMLAGTADDLLRRVPVEYRAQVQGWHDQFEDSIRAETTRLRTLCAAAPRETRKDFALWVKANHPNAAPYLFALLDGKEIREMLLDDLRKTVSPWPLVDPDEG